MKCVFRANTMYQLLLILLILDDNNENILFIGSNDLLQFKNKLIELGFFHKIEIQNYRKENFVKRNILTFFNAILFCLFAPFFKKEIILITSQHNIRGKLILEFFRAKRLYVIEDGYSSYKEYPQGIKNSLYLELKKDFYLKHSLRSYFINIENNNINRFYFTSKKKLEKEVPRVYDIINSKVFEIPILETIEKLKDCRKSKLKRLFFSNGEFSYSDSKTMVLLTQPLVEDGKMNFKELNCLIKVFEKVISKYYSEGYKVLIKQHPREQNKFYNELIKRYNIMEINKDFPFELVSMFNVKFDVGVTYYSTAIDSDIFKNKINLKENENGNCSWFL